MTTAPSGSWSLAIASFTPSSSSAICSIRTISSPSPFACTKGPKSTLCRTRPDWRSTIASWNLFCKHLSHRIYCGSASKTYCIANVIIYKRPPADWGARFPAVLGLQIWNYFRLGWLLQSNDLEMEFSVGRPRSLDYRRRISEFLLRKRR